MSDAKIETMVMITEREYGALREVTRLTAENEKLRAALRDVISSGLLHGPTTLSDEVLGTVHAALSASQEAPAP